MRQDLPTGTVTFLFTDVEGSTRLLRQFGPERYAQALADHRRVLRDAFVAEGGVEVDTQGDAFFVAFPTATGAAASAGVGQRALAPGPIAVPRRRHRSPRRRYARLGGDGADLTTASPPAQARRKRLHRVGTLRQSMNRRSRRDSCRAIASARNTRGREDATDRSARDSSVAYFRPYASTRSCKSARANLSRLPRT